MKRNIELRYSLTGHLLIAGLLATLAIPSLGCQGGPFSSSSGEKTGLLGLSRRDKLMPSSEDAMDPLGSRNVNRLLIQDLSPDQIGTTISSRFSRGNNSEKATKAFNEGQILYEKALALRESDPDSKEAIETFEEAAKQFRIASSQWKDSAIEQDALFYEGESLFFANRYVQSNRTFEKLIALYNGTRYLDKAEARRFAIAQFWLGVAREEKKNVVKAPRPSAERPMMGLASESRRILNRIRIDDPTGKLADDATMALGNAFFEAEMYQEAADTYEDLRNAYPGYPNLFQAHVFELKARMNSYYGNSYDIEPLEKSDELLKLIVRRFPNEARKEEAYLGQEAVAIRSMLAERDFTLGEYYEKRGENRAAMIMFEQVAQRFGGTDFSNEAVERVAELDGKPAIPTQHGQWLVDMMSKDQEAKPLIASGDRESLFR
ncbi:MAG: outer membrane protein assembly factor BamD [Pirellulaceae bacterium]